MIRLRRRSLDQSPGLQDRGRSQCRGQHGAALFPRNQKCRGQRDIHQHNLKRNSVDAGPRRDAAERDVIDLRDAEQVPGKSGDARARQLDRDPQKRRQSPAAAGSRARTGQQAHQQAEESVIQTEIAAEEKQREHCHPAR